MAVDDIKAEKQRDAQPCFLDRYALQLTRFFGGVDAENRADFARFDVIGDRCRG